MLVDVRRQKCERIPRETLGHQRSNSGLRPTCDERPFDVHIVGRNASPTTAAKFLVFLVKCKGCTRSDTGDVTRGGSGRH